MTIDELRDLGTSGQLYAIRVSMKGEEGHAWLSAQDNGNKPDLTYELPQAWRHARENVANIRHDLVRPCFPAQVVLEVVPLDEALFEPASA